MKPTYKHDCEKCKFVLATYDRDRTDWYVCEGSDPSVVGRFGNAGPDYLSSPREMVERPEFVAPMPVFSMDPDRAAVPETRIVAAFVLAQYKEQTREDQDQ